MVRPFGAMLIVGLLFIDLPSPSCHRRHQHPDGPPEVFGPFDPDAEQPVEYFNRLLVRRKGISIGSYSGGFDCPAAVRTT
jgi:hypothetical protein